MNTKNAITLATNYLQGLVGHDFEVLEIAKPVSPDAAVNLAKIISKLSPLVGNLIEFNTCEYLNDQPDFKGVGKWRRQDPGFPDTIFDSPIVPTPGFEIKAWFPLSTEITARFKDSQNHFLDDQTHVVMLAWLPDFLIYGKPKIVGIVVVSGASVAKARDDHYHKPPVYLVLEPENTSARTVNLQQTNTNGYRFQGTTEQLHEAAKIVSSWGSEGVVYKPNPEYQALLRQLIARFPYRLDTNFAKMDRIIHSSIETFKTTIYQHKYHGETIGTWNKVLSSGNDAVIRSSLAKHFDIRDSGEPVVE